VQDVQWLPVHRPSTCVHKAHASALLVSRLTPTLAMIPENRHIVAVASGWRHSLALDAQGRVYSWGWGSYGQLGHGQRQ
jgi:alpha-tubulin suppressor-like RCC1 family protein